MSGLDDLRESLREAARADVEANRARSRRRKNRATGVVALALLGGAAAAGAADLISIGEPVRNLPDVNRGYRPPGGRPGADPRHGAPRARAAVRGRDL